MKTLILSISKIKVIDVKDTFIVLLGISIILGAVMLLDFFHLIKAYSWQ